MVILFLSIFFALIFLCGSGSIFVIRINKVAASGSITLINYKFKKISFRLYFYKYFLSKKYKHWSYFVLSYLNFVSCWGGARWLSRGAKRPKEGAIALPIATPQYASQPPRDKITRMFNWMIGTFLSTDQHTNTFRIFRSDKQWFER